MAHAAVVTSRRDEALGLSRAAVLYGIRELALRAGVSAHAFRHWRVEFQDPGFVNVFVQPGTSKHIRFLQNPPQFWEDTNRARFRTSVASWPNGEKSQLGLDLRIPFASVQRQGIRPLFSLVSKDCLECPLDLPASAVLTLSRFEETLPHSRDEHDRFAASSSIASREGFLHRPIVDEWGLALAEALQLLLPGWLPAERRLRVKLGHDVDVLGIPMRIRTTAAHTLRRGHPAATVRDIIAQFTRVDTAYQRLLREVVQLSVDHELDAAVYWKFSVSGPHDTGYDPRKPRIQEMISEFRSKGLEMGIHPSYGSFRAPDRFRAEVGMLQELLGDRRLGGRQDFLRWHPENWIEWESLGLAYDASVGFADRVGFRAGTCHPYRPWLLSLNREADLLEIPLIAMDSTLQGYMKLSADQALQKLLDCAASCRAVGGVFSLLWHNTTLMDSGYSTTYRRLLKVLAASEAYDWKASANEFPCN